MSITRKILKTGFYIIYSPASKIWRWLDRTASWHYSRFWIDNLPDAIFTPATYSSYAGWLHNQGFFSALLSTYLTARKPHIFDFGCGMGSLAPVAHFFVREGGKFVGVDTDATSIKACLETYGALQNCEFYRTSDENPFYTQADHLPKRADIDWPVADSTQDMLIAMSVFTHLQEKDAARYMDKICRVLKADGRAIISFLLVRDYASPNETYRFTHELTPGWFTSNPECPEKAIGITREALDRLLMGRFKVLCHIEGLATGGRHPAPQDIFVLERILER